MPLASIMFSTMNSLRTVRLTTLKVIPGEVTALASHQCGSGSIPILGVIYGLSLLVLYSALRGFSPGSLVLPFPQKSTFDLSAPALKDLTLK